MSETATKFSCGACNRKYTWKPELAGKRVKCACGHVMTVSEEPPEIPAPEPDALFDLAPDPAPAPVKKAPKVPLAPIRRSEPEREHVSAPPMAASAAAATAPLGYQRGPSAREAARVSDDVALDMKRDIHAPVALLVLGFLLYVGFYAFRFDLDGGEVAVTAFGLGIMTAIKAGLMIGFAFVVAGPLGVSFGGVGTAVLKLAAIAVFCDGITTWVDYFIGQFSGGFGTGGIAGYGLMSFPIALGIYWVLLIYLFSMDSGDSWMVVMLLAVFDQIVKTILMVVILATILSWGGVSGGAVAALGGAPANPMREEIKVLKQRNQIMEAREFIGGGRQEFMLGFVNDWYANGCTNVYFTVSRDINGRPSAQGVLVELPEDPAKRAKCYQIYKAYLERIQYEVDEEDLEDIGEAFLEVPVRG